jgi:hypothetical protein
MCNFTAMGTPQPPQPPKKKPFRWGQDDPDHPLDSWWGRWLVRRKKTWRPPGPPGAPPPPGQNPPS